MNSPSGTTQLNPRRGRPPKDPPWLQPVAERMARGLSLRRALFAEGVYGLSEGQIRGIYRLVRFRKYVDEARIAHWREWKQLPRRRNTRAIDKLLERLEVAEAVGFAPRF